MLGKLPAPTSVLGKHYRSHATMVTAYRAPLLITGVWADSSSGLLSPHASIPQSHSCASSLPGVHSPVVATLLSGDNASALGDETSFPNRSDAARTGTCVPLARGDTTDAAVLAPQGLDGDTAWLFVTAAAAAASVVITLP